MTAQKGGAPPGGEAPETHCGLAAAQIDRQDNKPASALLQEFCEANAALHDGALDWTLRQGVPESAIYKTNGAIIGVGRIETSTSYFEFNPGGRPAIVLAALWMYERTLYEEALETIGDLVAWHPAEPDKWYMRRGVAAVLNPEAIERAVHFGEPLPLWETPLAWLQNGMAGCVVLDWQADLTFHFGNVRQINCQSRRLAGQIDTALRQQHQMPEILHREVRNAA